MEKEKVSISMTARQLEALKDFGKKHDSFSNLIWTTMMKEAEEIGLIRIKEPSPPRRTFISDEARVELLKELVSEDLPVEGEEDLWPQPDLDTFQFKLDCDLLLRLQD
jgi:hypothetical protein